MNRKLLSTAIFIIALGGIASGHTKTRSALSYSRSLDDKHDVVPAKKSRVRLYPNPTSDGNLSVTTNPSADNIHFYVFDLEGTMVRQVVLNQKRKHKIKNLQKGIYVYDVFVNDTSIEQGKIIVK